MSIVKACPPQQLIESLANHLKNNVPEIKPPPWALVVKTGVHKERLPQNPNWWYIRCAAILRKLYLSGRPVGVVRLSTAFGGRMRVGAKGREHFRRGSRSIIRRALQQLEGVGFVVKDGNRGRRLSPKGMSLLDQIAKKVFKEVQRQVPELKKYL
ncbi:MAG: 30S ribosomal protein S19e [Candidatus Nezhaarchaeales archaeon]